MLWEGRCRISRLKADGSRDRIEVHLDAIVLGRQRRVGWLNRSGQRSDVPASFEYDEAWLAGPDRFMLDPRLELWKGEQHPPSKAPTFGVFMDSAPDRWGRVLMERREALAAGKEGRSVRGLQELDFLLGVHDLTRMGALRLKRPTGPFLDDSGLPVPPLASLRELASISRRLEESGIEELPEYERWLATMLAPGSSLGGARPKSNYIETDGQLWIAKFPAKEDRYDVGGWEIIVHQLARSAGIVVPRSRCMSLTPMHQTFCVERFDRQGGRRLMYSSAMTLLEYRDGSETGGYLELAEFLSDQGAQGHIGEDLGQLFRRVLFNVLVGNRDDHLRNHGFIRDSSGWRLSPAFDLNSSPYTAGHALNVDELSNEPDISTALRTAPYYRLGQAEADAILAQLRDAVSPWKDIARAQGLPRSEIQMMESVFQV